MCFRCRSPQEGVVFQTMRKYLHSISHLGVRRSHDNTHEQTTASNDQANQLLPPAEKYQKFTKTRAIVELVTMFTDVAGEVREKSQFKVYTNHCYTVNKDSKPVVIEILDTWDSCLSHYIHTQMGNKALWWDISLRNEHVLCLWEKTEPMNSCLHFADWMKNYL